jgi:hypothetical protein
MNSINNDLNNIVFGTDIENKKIYMGYPSADGGLKLSEARDVTNIFMNGIVSFVPDGEFKILEKVDGGDMRSIFIHMILPKHTLKILSKDFIKYIKDFLITVKTNE